MENAPSTENIISHFFFDDKEQVSETERHSLALSLAMISPEEKILFRKRIYEYERKFHRPAGFEVYCLIVAVLSLIFFLIALGPYLIDGKAFSWLLISGILWVITSSWVLYVISAASWQRRQLLKSLNKMIKTT